jgi:hypothetical protein
MSLKRICKDENAIEDYYKEHTCCPMCGSSENSQTLVGYVYNGDEPYIDKNIVECLKCGWKGIIHDLITKKS